MSEPIFRSVYQALNTSFILEYERMSQKGATQIVLEDLRKRGGYLSEKRPDRGMNLGGMSPLEFRGQCAIIRRTVESSLKGAHIDAINAYYGLQLRQAAGVKALCDLLGSLCNTRSDSALKAMMWSIYDRRQSLSINAIAVEYAINRKTVTRDLSLLRKLTHNLQVAAETRLEAMFVARGLVASRDN